MSQKHRHSGLFGAESQLLATLFPWRRSHRGPSLAPFKGPSYPAFKIRVIFKHCFKDRNLSHSLDSFLNAWEDSARNTDPLTLPPSTPFSNTCLYTHGFCYFKFKYLSCSLSSSVILSRHLLVEHTVIFGFLTQIFTTRVHRC